MAPLERIVFAAGMFLAIWAGTKAVGRLVPQLVGWRMRKSSFSFPTGDGNPTLLYFRSDECSSCRLQEGQILEAQRILERSGRTIAVLKFDAMADKGLVRALNILTVPTTVLINGDGSVASWNAGFRDHHQILDQFLHAQTAPAKGRTADGSPPHNRKRNQWTLDFTTSLRR